LLARARVIDVVRRLPAKTQGVPAITYFAGGCPAGAYLTKLRILSNNNAVY
jgi:hypothetical protein